MQDSLNRKGRRLLPLLLAVCLGVGTSPAFGAADEGELEPFSALTPELEAITVSAGHIHQPFSSTSYVYDMTLGPGEDRFSLTAVPAEKEWPPTIEVLLDGNETDGWILSDGEPSPPVEVETGQSRQVTVRSRACEGEKKQSYTISVYRTGLSLVWKPGEVCQTQEGAQVLPVSLYAPPGTELRVLDFALGFDPNILELAEAGGAVTEDIYQCVETADGFTYNPFDKTGFFKELDFQADNVAGVLRIQYGKDTKSRLECFRSTEESGRLLAVYFRIKGELKADSLFVFREDERISQGIAVVDGSGRELVCADMVSVEGLPQETAPADPDDSGAAFTGPALGVMEVDRESLPGTPDAAGQNLEVRPLVFVDSEGVQRFGFQEDVFDYDLYLLPGDEAGLILRSLNDVTAVTAAGLWADDGTAETEAAGGGQIALIRDPSGSGTGPYGVNWWADVPGRNLTLRLQDGETDRTVRLLLTDAAGNGSVYTVSLHRAAERPRSVLSASGGRVTATVEQSAFRTVSLALILTPEKSLELTEEAVRTQLERSLSGAALSVAKVTLSDPQGLQSDPGGAPEGAKELRILLDTGDSSDPVSTLDHPMTIALFEGDMRDVWGVGGDEGNTIGDARLGALFRTTALAGTATLSGTILAYHGGSLPEVTLYEAELAASSDWPETTLEAAGIPAEVVLLNGQTGYGLKEFQYTVSLKAGVPYTMRIQKTMHTSCTVGGIMLAGNEGMNPIPLYAGDFDGDGWISLFDADLLTLHSGRGGGEKEQAAQYDLDGDGAVTLFDLDVLTGKENYGGRNRAVAWEYLRKGGEIE